VHSADSGFASILLFDAYGCVGMRPASSTLYRCMRASSRDLSGAQTLRRTGTVCERVFDTECAAATKRVLSGGYPASALPTSASARGVQGAVSGPGVTSVTTLYASIWGTGVPGWYPEDVLLARSQCVHAENPGNPFLPRSAFNVRGHATESARACFRSRRGCDSRCCTQWDAQLRK